MSGFEVKHAYFPAKSSAAAAGAGGRASGGVLSPDDLAADYKPSVDECRLLTEPIEHFLSQCACYDMMGMSTQVVVVDVDATLAVAFIAAQETRVQSCVLWDPRKREFVGVLSSTDYIKILLYCEARPEEAEQVSSWSIRRWREVMDEAVTPALLGAAAQTDSAGAKKVRPAAIVTCTADTSLRDCLAKMKDFHVRRTVALAEKEAASFSVVAMMDVAQIVEYLGMMFFHIEKAGGSLWQSPGMKAGADRAGSPASSKGPLGVPTSDSASEPNSARRAGSSGSSTLGVNNTSMISGGDGTGGADNHNGAGNNTGSGFFGIDATTLPPHVSSILSAAESAEAAAAEPQVGPYRSIFDIPFKNLPANVGVHRRTSIYVTMDSPLNEALKLMLRNDVESVPVCSTDLIIVDVVSRSDLLRMENQGVYDTSLTVREALASKISDSIYVIYEQDTVRDIFAHFVRRRVKELFIVDPDTDKLQGQLNISEFVFFLVFAHIKGAESAEASTSDRNPSSTGKPSSASTGARK